MSQAFKSHVFKIGTMGLISPLVRATTTTTTKRNIKLNAAILFLFPCRVSSRGRNQPPEVSAGNWQLKQSRLTVRYTCGCPGGPVTQISSRLGVGPPCVGREAQIFIPDVLESNKARREVIYCPRKGR